ncbi:cytochrome P450, partial [Mycena rosella]
MPEHSVSSRPSGGLLGWTGVGSGADRLWVKLAIWPWSSKKWYAACGTSSPTILTPKYIGNTFTLLFAGHESTACGLAATLGFLAIRQGEEQTAYEEILKLSGDVPSWSLHPVGGSISHLGDDGGRHGQIIFARPAEKNIVFKKGALMIIDMIAVQHNPHFFPKPEEYRPSRWCGAAETDVLMFGLGPRACFGRKFSHAEAMSPR